MRIHTAGDGGRQQGTAGYVKPKPGDTPCGACGIEYAVNLSALPAAHADARPGSAHLSCAWPAGSGRVSLYNPARRRSLLDAA